MTMVEGRRALDAALDLAKMPTLAPTMRAQLLPTDTLVVIRIAAGCEYTCRDAAKLTGVRSDAIKEAAVHYLQQMLFGGECDSHRTLGVQPDASRSVMREHLRWLMKWLHPDRNASEWESVFAERVLKAWRDIGSTPAGAVSVGQSLTPAPQTSRGHRTLGQRRAVRWVAVPLASEQRKGKRQRTIVVIAGVIGLILVLVPAHQLLLKWFGTTAAEIQASTENTD